MERCLARLKNEDHDKLHEGITMERLRALNWLVRTAENWDEVSTDT